ncbi:ferritin-like domain-containing protein [Fibrella sp. USSR17]
MLIQHNEQSGTDTQLSPEHPSMILGRRLFLRYAGITAASASLLITACSKNEMATGLSPQSVDLGTGDTGILNYAYALEQLEAAFYTQVIATPYSGMSADEMSILTEIRDHEIIHRDFFKAAIGSAAITGLTPNFGAINFNDRNSVLTTARTFEDLGVSAYNGAGKLIKDVNYLLLAGKIVSVEARHAAIIRDLLSPKTASFAGDDVVTASNGLDGALLPAAVLAAAQPFVMNKITANLG